MQRGSLGDQAVPDPLPPSHACMHAPRAGACGQDHPAVHDQPAAQHAQRPARVQVQRELLKPALASSRQRGAGRVAARGILVCLLVVPRVACAPGAASLYPCVLVYVYAYVRRWALPGGLILGSWPFDDALLPFLCCFNCSSDMLYICTAMSPYYCTTSSCAFHGALGGRMGLPWCVSPAPGSCLFCYRFTVHNIQPKGLLAAPPRHAGAMLHSRWLKMAQPAKMGDEVGRRSCVMRWRQHARSFWRLTWHCRTGFTVLLPRRRPCCWGVHAPARGRACTRRHPRTCACTAAVTAVPVIASFNPLICAQSMPASCPRKTS